MADTPGTLRPIGDPWGEMERLAEARKQPVHEFLLADSSFIAETRKLPDGTDEVNMVRIRVTADSPVKVAAAIHQAIMDAVRPYLILEADGGREA